MKTLEELQALNEEAIKRSFDPFFAEADRLVDEFFAANSDAPTQYVFLPGMVVLEIKNPGRE